MYVYICSLFTHTQISLSLSLSLYIYIYIYVYREREGERYIIIEKLPLGAKNTSSPAPR